MIFDFFKIILTNLGLDGLLLPFNDLLALFNGLTWETLASVLTPTMFFSWLYYFSWGFASYQILLVFPFRLFKKLIKFPHKKEVK